MITLQKSPLGKEYFLIVVNENKRGTRAVRTILAVTPQELLDLLKILEERKEEIEAELKGGE